MQKGFTLIEVLIYTALFSLIIGGLLVIVYAMLDTNEDLENKILVNEEGNFLVNKISQTFEDAKQVIKPFSTSSPTTSSQLIIVLPPPIATTTIRLINTDMVYQYGADTIPLNDTGAKITELNFQYFPANSDYHTPAGLKVSFKINNRPFTILKYKRK